MASFWQRWGLVAALAFITLMMASMQQEHHCPSLYEIWQAEKNAGHDPLPDLMAAAGMRPDQYRSTKPPQARQTPAAVQRVLQKVTVRSETGVAIPSDVYVPDVEVASHVELLNSDYIPNTVFYIWCGRRWFEFQHYLSVKSVIRELKPDNLVFYHETLPVDDYWLYNTWFKELREEYPFFRLRQLADNEAWGSACVGDALPSMDFISKRLYEHGGVYMNERTILDRIPVWYRNYSVVTSLEPKDMKGFLMAKPRVAVQQLLAQGRNAKVKRITCAAHNVSYDKAPKRQMCVHTGATFFPENIWELDSNFGRLARRIFYGTTQILRPQPSYDQLIPNIAHIVWLGGGEMDFLFYLSVLSLLYVAKVDHLYIHGNGPPAGGYWQRVKSHPRLHLIYRETPRTVYGTEVQVLSHITDVWRVDFMIRYGGIYVDTDTVFVKPLDDAIRGYDAVGSVDWTYWNPPFPDTINFGVAIGKRNAPYWHEFQKSMKWWIDKDWSWNGLRQPYKIKERYPQLVKIDPHLQVICYQYKCHPTWLPNYHNESIHHLNANPITDWREDVYAFHWTLPTPPELKSEQDAIESDSMFAEIARYVLHEAGLLKKDLKLKYTKHKLT